MTRIAFFADDPADPAVRRRVVGFTQDGLQVSGFCARRPDKTNACWENIELGPRNHGGFVNRMRAVVGRARIAAGGEKKLAEADVIYARGPDMLATAFIAKRMARLRTPVLYEALDIDPLRTRKGLVGFCLRRIEGALLRRTKALVISSPGLLDQHFARRHRGRFAPYVLENRLPAGVDYGPRPVPGTARQGPVRVGWIGVLRCRRSFELLLQVARVSGVKTVIHLHGLPDLAEIPDFHERIRDVPNIILHERYRSSGDLAAIYRNLDVVWAGDFATDGSSTSRLLPNRLYEGGYFGVPAIAPAGTQAASWIEARGAGFTVLEDMGATLPTLINSLAFNASPVAVRRKRLLDLPDSTFVAQRGELAELVRRTLELQASSAAAGAARGKPRAAARKRNKAGFEPVSGSN